MKKTKKCLFLMPLGSEIRQFGHSGVIADLLDAGWEVIVAAKFVDGDLKNQLDPRVILIPLIQEFPSVRFARLQKILDHAHQILEARHGKKQWQYLPQKNQGFRQKINSWILEKIAIFVSYSPKLYLYLSQYEQFLESTLASSGWLKLFTDFEITVLVVNVPNINSLITALATAKIKNIPRVLLFHTSKDIAANGRLSHRFTKIGVWNERMKQELLRKNPNLNSEDIAVVGCAHFDCVGRLDLLLPEHIFRQQIAAKPKSKLILFPASAPWVVPDEGRYVWVLVEAIKTGKIDPELQIVVRKNPMDETNYWENEFSFCEQVLVLKSDWRWDARFNWGFQRYNDMIVYNSLLHYSVVNVGVPSTVALECVISNLPNINIGFNLPGFSPLPGSMEAFWKADFYKDIVQNKLASLANDEKQLFLLINTNLNKQDVPINNNGTGKISQILGVLPPMAAKKYVDVLEAIVEAR
jgi:hypothetical protein